MKERRRKARKDEKDIVRRDRWREGRGGREKQREMGAWGGGTGNRGPVGSARRRGSVCCGKGQPWASWVIWGPVTPISLWP